MGNLPFPSSKPHKILHRPFSCLIGIPLALRILRCGCAVTPPMIEYPGNMLYRKLLRFFSFLILSQHQTDSPEHQIIVLCAIADTAKLKFLHHLPFHHHKMADIIIG